MQSLAKYQKTKNATKVHIQTVLRAKNRALDVFIHFCVMMRNCGGLENSVFLSTGGKNYYITYYFNNPIAKRK